MLSVLWIHEILVRIRIRGSLPLTNGIGSSCYFVSDLEDVNNKKFPRFFCLLLFEGT